MIRINLAAGSPKRGSGPTRARAASRVAWVSAASLLSVLLWAGWQVRVLHERAERVAGETRAADSTLRELAPVMERLASLEADRGDLAARAGAATAWREKRFAVAGLLTQIGRSVPGGMQLSELRQDDGGIVLGGRAVSVAVVSEFVVNLERSEQVLPPVEIIDTQAEEGDSGQAVRFAVRARISPPAS